MELDETLDPSELSTVLQKKISQYIEPATIVTVIFGVTYYFGWTYIHFYLGQLGINHDSLEFPIYFYVTKAILPIFIPLLIFYWSFVNSSDKPKTLKQTLRANFFIFVIIVLVFYTGMLFYPKHHAYLFFLASVIGLIAFIFLAREKTAFLNYWYKHPQYRLPLIFFSFIIFWIFAAYFGIIMATNTVEGGSNNPIVNFSWKDKTPSELEGKELIFIIHSQGKYYVVNKQKPAPEYTQIYVINDDQIKFAVMEKNNSNLILLNNFLK